MTGNDLRKTVLETLADVAPDADVIAIDEARTFHDQFEIDSVDFMNLMLALERRLSVHIPEADYPKLATLDGCLRFLGSIQPQAADSESETGSP